jgi:hypothetical protein
VAILWENVLDIASASAHDLIAQDDSGVFVEVVMPPVTVTCPDEVRFTGATPKPDAAFDRLAWWLEQAVDLAPSNVVVDARSDWVLVETGVTSQFISFIEGRSRFGSARRSRRMTRFERWLARLCQRHAGAREQLAELLRMLRRSQRRFARRRRARPPLLALRAVITECTTVIRRHGPPAGRLPQFAASRL